MKRLLLRSGKSPFHVATPEQFIQQDLIGTNSGNLLFSDAVHKLLLTDRTEVTSNGIKTDCSPERAQQINEDYDAFVVPLANAFRPSFRKSLDRLSTLIEQLTIPVVVVGVGAQTGEDYGTDQLRPLDAPVKRFCKAVLERSASIGVRGELTADYLRGLGFSESEVDIIGCPSMFLHGDTFPTPREPGAFTADSRIAINLSPDALEVGDVSGIARHARDWFPHLTYYAQNLVDAELLFWGDTTPQSGERGDFPLQLSHPLLQENKVRVPLDPATWMDELRTFDFAYGTRIHGNIAALLAGTPSVVLAHDSRTLELCRYFDIPHQPLSQLPADTHPEALYEKADYSAMISGHKERFDRFTAFLDKNSLDNVFTHGDGGVAFDARVAGLDLPPSIQVWDGADDGSLRYRFSWLREQTRQLRQAHAATDRRISEMSKKNQELRERLTTVEEMNASLQRLNASLTSLDKRMSSIDKRVSGIEKRAAVRLGPAIRRRWRRLRSANR